MSTLSGLLAILHRTLTNTSEQPDTRVRAGQQLCAPKNIGGKEAVAAFVSANLSANPVERVVALRLITVAQVPLDPVFDVLTALVVGNEDYEVCELASAALIAGPISAANLVSLRTTLLRVLNYYSDGVVADEVEFEKRIGSGKHLLKLQDGPSDVREFVRSGLSVKKNRRVALELVPLSGLTIESLLDEVLDCCRDADERVRYMAVEALAKLNDPRVLAALLVLLNSPTELVQVYMACGDHLVDARFDFPGFATIESLGNFTTDAPPPEAVLLTAEGTGIPAVINYVKAFRASVSLTARILARVRNPRP